MRFYSTEFSSPRSAPSYEEQQNELYVTKSMPFRSSLRYAPATSPVTPEVQTLIKHKLLPKLNHGELSNMPAGFPFRYLPDMQGGAAISYGPYEFNQQISVAKSWEPRHDHTVVVAYSPPTHPEGRDCYTWSISLPTISNKPSRSVRNPAQTISAEVTMDRGVTRSHYFSRIHSDPRIIFRALAISLEYGVAIEVRLVDHEMANVLSGALHIADIAYLGTNTQGARQLLYGLDAHTLEAKFCVVPTTSKS